MSLEARMTTLEGLVRRLLTVAQSSSGGVTSVFTRTGDVVADAADYAGVLKLDDCAAPDDNTDLDFSTTKHGLVPKGTNVGDFLKDDGTWDTPASGSWKMIFTSRPGDNQGAGTRYYPVGSYGAEATESNVNIRFPMAGTVKKPWVQVTANTLDDATTYTIRDDGADTAVVVTITASTTGAFVDDTNTAAIAADSLVTAKIVRAGTGSMNVNFTSLEYDS